jgi:hypothetical protein
MGMTKLALCRHEAAHAIIAERFGCRVLWVQAGEHGKSYTQLGRTPIGPLAMACIIMAGSLAEAIWHRSPKGLVSADDYEKLQGMGLKGEDFRLVWEATRRLVWKNRVKILALARELLPGKRIKRGKR